MKELNGIPSLEMNKVRNICCKLSELIGTGWNIPEKDDYIDITEWPNGDGFVVTFGDGKIINMGFHEFDAIQYLINKMMYEFKR